MGNDPKYHYRNLKDLGDCHAAMGNLKQAGSCYEQAAALAPHEAAPHAAMGMLAAREGDLPRAKEHYRQALQISPSCMEACSGLAVIYQQTHEFSLAFEMYMKCLEIDADNLVALLGLFQTSCQMGNFSQITRYLEIYLANHPQDSSVLFCLATLYARDNRLEEARKTTLTVLSLEPENLDAQILLSQIERNLEKLLQFSHD